MFVCLFCDILSHGTSIAVWSETSITGFVLHASKAHCPEISVPSLICVSLHMLLWQYWTAPAANGVDAQWLKTNPSHRKKWWGKEKRGGERDRQEVVEKTMAALYFIVLKGYSSQWSHCQTPCLYIHGGNQPNAKLIYGRGRGEMAHHEVTQTDCTPSDVLHLKWQNACAISYSINVQSWHFIRVLERDRSDDQPKCFYKLVIDNFTHYYDKYLCLLWQWSLVALPQ